MQILYKSTTTDYVDITTESEVDAPNNIIIRNNSTFVATVITAVSKPDESEKGFPIYKGETVTIPQVVGSKVWVKARVGAYLFLTDSISAITTPSVVKFPAELLSSASSPGVEFLRTVTVPRQEASIIAGNYFVENITLTGLAATSTRYYTITAGAHAVVIESLSTTLDFTTITAGRVEFRVEAFAEDSNQNAWSVSGEAVISPGRCLNTSFINATPEYVVRSATGASITGTHDFLLDFATCVNTGSGSNIVQRASEAPLFSWERQIIIPPGKKVLIKSFSVGTAATGTYSTKSINALSEAPVIL